MDPFVEAAPGLLRESCEYWLHNKTVSDLHRMAVLAGAHVQPLFGRRVGQIVMPLMGMDFVVGPEAACCHSPIRIEVTEPAPLTHETLSLTRRSGIRWGGQP